VCPVLAFTPEVEHTLGWFFATHERSADGWRRTSLPAAGGAGEQDCRLMAELEFLKGVMTRIVIAERERAQPRGRTPTPAK
jgi:hypothetical protein